MAAQHFPEIPLIRPAEPGSAEALAFRHYDPSAADDRRTTMPGLRFAVAYWHALREVGHDPLGPGPVGRLWEKGGDPITVAKRRLDAAFEFFVKLRSPFWCFRDRDVVLDGDTLVLGDRSLAVLVAHVEQLQRATGLKLLAGTACLPLQLRGVGGAARGLDGAVCARAAAQARKVLEVTRTLGGANCLLRDGSAGFAALFSPGGNRERDNLAGFLRTVAAMARDVGFSGQLLLETGPADPAMFPPGGDIAAGHAFLRTHHLAGSYKFHLVTSLPASADPAFAHRVREAATAGVLGGIGLSMGDLPGGADAGRRDAARHDLTCAMGWIRQAGSLDAGGLGIAAGFHRYSSSVDPVDLARTYVYGMDACAAACMASSRLESGGGRLQGPPARSGPAVGTTPRVPISRSGPLPRSAREG